MIELLYLKSLAVLRNISRELVVEIYRYTGETSPDNAAGLDTTVRDLSLTIMSHVVNCENENDYENIICSLAAVNEFVLDFENIMNYSKKINNPAQIYIMEYLKRIRTSIDEIVPLLLQDKNHN